jgi:hypothetical protein
VLDDALFLDEASFSLSTRATAASCVALTNRVMVMKLFYSLWKSACKALLVGPISLKKKKGNAESYLNIVNSVYHFGGGW